MYPYDLGPTAVLTQPEHNRPGRVVTTEVVIEAELSDLLPRYENRECIGRGTSDSPFGSGRVAQIVDEQLHAGEAIEATATGSTAFPTSARRN